MLGEEDLGNGIALSTGLFGRWAQADGPYSSAQFAYSRIGLTFAGPCLSATDATHGAVLVVGHRVDM